MNHVVDRRSPFRVDQSAAHSSSLAQRVATPIGHGHAMMRRGAWRAASGRALPPNPLQRAQGIAETERERENDHRGTAGRHARRHPAGRADAPIVGRLGSPTVRPFAALLGPGGRDRHHRTSSTPTAQRKRSPRTQEVLPRQAYAALVFHP